MIIETEVADKDKSILLSFSPIFLSGIFSDLLYALSFNILLKVKLYSYLAT